MSAANSGNSTYAYAYTNMLSEIDVARWMTMSLFEIWLHLLGLLLSSVLLTFKVFYSLDAEQLSYWTVFSPLLCVSALDAYYIIIVFLRTYYIDRVSNTTTD